MKNSDLKEKEIFGFPVYFLMQVFLVAAVTGWIYEMLFYRINDGCFINRGHGFGPWLPIYGFGGLFITLVSERVKGGKLAVFAVSGIISGALELATGAFLYYFLDGLRLWDYNTEIWNFGNIGGFICLRSVLVFAFAGIGFVYKIVPILTKINEKEKDKAVMCTYILMAIVALDVVFGYFIRPLL